MAASIKGLVPDGVESFKGKINKVISYIVTTEGLYGVRCTPHFGIGMVAIIAVGASFEKDTFLEGKKVTKKAKERFNAILSNL